MLNVESGANQIKNIKTTYKDPSYKHKGIDSLIGRDIGFVIVEDKFEIKPNIVDIAPFPLSTTFSQGINDWNNEICIPKLFFE